MVLRVAGEPDGEPPRDRCLTINGTTGIDMGSVLTPTMCRWPFEPNAVRYAVQSIEPLTVEMSTDFSWDGVSMLDGGGLNGGIYDSAGYNGSGYLLHDGYRLSIASYGKKLRG